MGSLVLAQFHDIKELSDELDSLSEFQSCFVLPTPEYALYTREFRESAQTMAAAGMIRDVGAALDAYTSMIGTCIQCHDYALERDPEPPRNYSSSAIFTMMCA